ncbi:MAG: cytochrome c [Pseudomonadota bacterium]
MRAVGLWAVGLLTTLAVHAQDAPSGSAARGQKIYMHQACYTCHGTVGQGGERGAGPKIAPNPWPWVAFAQQTRKPRGVMIPYSDKHLPDQDLADIYAYILTIKPGPAAKDIPLLSGF